jgi:hypothetical protein
LRYAELGGRACPDAPLKLQEFRIARKRRIASSPALPSSTISVKPIGSGEVPRSYDRARDQSSSPSASYQRAAVGAREGM